LAPLTALSLSLQIVAVILCNTGIALLAYMDGINQTPTLGGVVLGAAAAAGSAVYKVERMTSSERENALKTKKGPFFPWIDSIFSGRRRPFFFLLLPSSLFLFLSRAKSRCGLRGLAFFERRLAFTQRRFVIGQSGWKGH